jgi:hypothetical protein
MGVTLEVTTHKATHCIRSTEGILPYFNVTFHLKRYIVEYEFIIVTSLYFNKTDSNNKILFNSC